ncbi:hypothetical protein M758_12G063400 [Ceratodon purpureus]|nr:hypothetical protein M758_12G063400 [Ceratodon purpureus]
MSCASCVFLLCHLDAHLFCATTASRFSGLRDLLRNSRSICQRKTFRWSIDSGPGKHTIRPNALI